MTTTINKLIDAVKKGEMTAAEAGALVGDYAAEYYSPGPGEWSTYQEIRAEWKKRQKPPVEKQVYAYTKCRAEGQLWEPCRRCGAEPVFMPLHLCDRCWPK